MRAAIGRADLARLLVDLRAEEYALAGDLLGFDAPTLPRVAEPRGDRPPVIERVVERAPDPEAAFERVVAEVPREDESPAVFWRAERVEHDDTPEPLQQEQAPRPELTDDDWESPGRSLLHTPPMRPLAPWSRLWPVLRSALQCTLTGRDPDLRALVRKWSRGENLRSIPRVARAAWAQRATVYVDRSERLTPFWSDQGEVCRRLMRVFPRRALDLRVVDDHTLPQAAEGAGPLRESRLDATSRVIVLSDLGVYATVRERAAWLRVARRLRSVGARVSALVPAPKARCERALLRAWKASPWERGRSANAASIAHDESEREARAARLLTLLSPAQLVQPWLLRALRELLPADEADASTEVDAWRHPDVCAASATGLVLHPEAQKRWRERFRDVVREDVALAMAVRKELVRAREGMPRELARAETMIWSGLACGGVEPAERADAEGFAARLAGSAVAAVKDGDDDAPVLHFGRALLGGMPDAVYDEVPDLKLVWGASFRGVDGAAVPGNIDLMAIRRELEAPGALRRWSLRQVGGSLVATPAKDSAWPSASSAAGSPVATMLATRPFLSALYGGEEPRVEETREPWMSDTGVDRFGRWAEVRVGAVRFRLRWIPPGRFVMGSPETEVGRNLDEGPEHAVVLTRGYSLGETPVTQALWSAVMGSNPSEFKSPERPVEMVSWDDCHRFIARLNKLIPGLDARLPSEAEWEHACRAGTKTSTWMGDTEIKGARNAPLLDSFAWYSGNSGVGFELPAGMASSAWPEKQYAHTKAGTRAVGLKQANPFGLHDVLGNVFEWCEDRYGPYTKEITLDPTGMRFGTSRVLRGGSWYILARGVRAAYRLARYPHDRRFDIGFRLACGGWPSKPDREIVSERARKSHQLEGPTMRPRACVQLKMEMTPSISPRPTQSLALQTDRTAVVVRPWRREPWAKAAGRDRYGLWAEACVREAVLRLRWIPPGRFMMGSPATETGRWDARESPQHEVVLTRGYWIGETPVTQVLWSAVMGGNPSEFKSPERPVERVSWEDCQRFIVRLNELVPGLVMRLPTEAEWEYACRAGTTTATWLGDLEIRDDRDAPMLDSIAWYGGNSGVRYELVRGWDFSERPDEQYARTKPGTRAVRRKQANPYGLHDMLGNVWEWCADWYGAYGAASVVDPVGPVLGAERVLRGGSWGGDAKNIRASCRSAYASGSRSSGIGFRLVRGQAAIESGAEDEGMARPDHDDKGRRR